LQSAGSGINKVGTGKCAPKIQRENLNPLEESTALKRLVDEFEMTHQQVADTVARSRAAVSNLLRLQDLNPDVKVLLATSAFFTTTDRLFRVEICDPKAFRKKVGTNIWLSAFPFKCTPRL